MTNRLSERPHDRRLVYANALVEHLRRGFALTGFFKSVSSTVALSHEGIEIVFLLDYVYSCQVFFAHQEDAKYVTGKAAAFVHTSIIRFMYGRLKEWGEFNGQHE